MTCPTPLGVIQWKLPEMMSMVPLTWMHDHLL